MSQPGVPCVIGVDDDNSDLVAILLGAVDESARRSLCDRSG